MVSQGSGRARSQRIQGKNVREELDESMLNSKLNE